MVGLPEDGDGHLDATGVEPVLQAVGRADAVVLGPGLSKDPDAQALARAVVTRIDVPLVIDADGLNALAGRLEEIAQRRWPTVLTPHAGELGRLLGFDSAEIERYRLRYVREAAARAKAFVVLKGDDTLVAAPSGRVAISRGGAPGLATAGTGDVLAGVIGAMLAKGMPVAQGACAGVYAPRAGGPDRRRAERPGRRDRLRRDQRAARGAERLTSRAHAADGARHHGDRRPAGLSRGPDRAGRGHDAPPRAAGRARDQRGRPLRRDHHRVRPDHGRRGGRSPPAALHRALRGHRVPRVDEEVRGAAAQGARARWPAT